MRRPRRFAAFAGAATVLAATIGVASIDRCTPPAAAAAGLPSPKADILVDAGNGRVLIGDNIHKALHPASTAKIMTALTAVERLCPGALVTANAQDASVETMRIGLPVDKPWPFDQMMASMMMVSANDAAYAFAEHRRRESRRVRGRISPATAKQLGLQDSTLGDPAGLDDTTSYKGGPYMSAYDLAIATRNALAVPEIAKWAATHEYSVRRSVRRAPRSRQPQQDAAGRRRRLPRRDRVQDRLHRRRPSTRSSRSRPATAAR